MTKRHVSCPKCKSLETKRNGRRMLVSIPVQRFYCYKCRETFSIRHQSRSRISFHGKVKLTRQHLEGRTSVRTLARHTKHSTRTVMQAIHTVTKQCVTAAWIAQTLQPKWSGYLALDGKTVRVWDWSAKHFHYSKAERRWLHRMTLLVALDLGTLDVPAHHLGDEETTFDLILFLRTLRRLNYPLKGYVSDGNPDIEKAVKMVFGPGIPHQLCVRHFLQNLRLKLKQQQITEEAYRDACRQILIGRKPNFLRVPMNLFTYKRIPSLPRTNQSCENLIRFFTLRLKTLGQFRSYQYAADYCNALVLMRRFTPFTDRKDQPNGISPLELAGCDIEKIDYLKINQKSNR